MMDILFLWSFLRILVSMTAAAVSVLRPMSFLEKSIAVWPPTTPWADWLQRVSILPLFRWDANIYAAIAAHGPNVNDGTASFHPLYPMLSRLVMAFGLSTQLSLLIVSNFAGLGFLYYFYKLARLDADHELAHTSLLLLLFSPLSFLLFVPYSEALFLLLSSISLLYCRKNKWLVAGIAGGLATLTRQQGLFLIFPLIWELVEENQYHLRSFIRSWKAWLSISLIPLSYAAWILYRGLILNDVRLDFSHPIDAIYSIMLSPTVTEVVPQVRFLFPWQVISLTIEKIRLEPDIDIWTNMILGIIFIITAFLAWPRLRNSYRIFVVVNILVALSFYTGPVHPFMGMPRHMWLAFPVFLGIGHLVQKPWLRITAVLLGIFGMSFLLILYVLEAWVP